MQINVKNVFRSFGLLTAAFALIGCGGGKKVKDPGYGALRTMQVATDKGVLDVHFHPWEVVPNDDFDLWLEDKQSARVPTFKVKTKGKPFAKSDVWRSYRFTLMPLSKKEMAVRLACPGWAYRRVNGETEKSRLGKIVDIVTSPNLKMDDYKAQDAALQKTLNQECDDSSGPRRARRSAIASAIRTKPGKGVKKGKIKAALVSYNEGMSAGGLYQRDADVYILFKDKSAVKDPSAPLSDLNVAASKQLQSGKWYSWRRKGGNYQIRKRDESGKWSKWNKIKKPMRATRQKKKLKLDGRYKYAASGGSIYYGTSVSFGSYTFKRDRTYSSSSSSSYGGGMSTFTDMPSVNSFSHCSETGGSTITSASSTGVFMSSKSKRDDCGDGKAGEYLIDGFTITLSANNGVVKRLPFFRFGKGGAIS